MDIMRHWDVNGMNLKAPLQRPSPKYLYKVEIHFFYFFTQEQKKQLLNYLWFPVEK